METYTYLIRASYAFSPLPNAVTYYTTLEDIIVKVILMLCIPECYLIHDFGFKLCIVKCQRYDKLHFICAASNAKKRQAKSTNRRIS